MSRQKMEWGRATLAVALALIAGLAQAEPDTFFLGSGRDGALTVSTAATVVNRYAQVVSPLLEGDKNISVATDAPGNFQSGDLVMVFQTTGLVTIPESGSTEVTTLYNSPVGRWELVRLESVTAASGGATLSLTAPLVYSYAAQVSQVIRVPEYSTVQIDTGATIEAMPWNGATGGVIAFLVQGKLTNNGKILATGVGFRGGQTVKDPAENLGCEGLDEAAPKGAQKGEGLANVRYGPAHTGLGNVANGGGGGVCLQAGGGGGGNGGSGGRGGFSNNLKDGSRWAMGLPGAEVMVFPVDHLSMGGGGGAGHGVNGTTGSGGNGGGVILVRANSLEGTGSIEADGTRGVYTATVDAGGGGGAGGTIHLRFAGTASCGGVRARGGSGGASYGGDAYVGPGGGGGGGVVLMQSTGGTCDVSVNGGTSGPKQDNVGGVSYGSHPGRVGDTEIHTSAYAVPLTPTVETPANGAFVANKFVFVSGKTQPGVSVYIYIDGLKVAGAIGTSSGTYSASLPEQLADGSHRIEVAAELLGAWSARSAANVFTMDATPPPFPVITVPAPNAWVADTTPTISGTAEPGSTVTVLLNGGPREPVTADSSGNWSYTPSTELAEKSYTLAAGASDAAGNSSPYTDNIQFTVDATAPDTLINSKPDTTSSTSSASFTFSSNEAGSGFECSLDDGTFTACTSPANFSLSEGRHSFAVRAQDMAGNVDASAATFSWIIDMGAPDVSITEKPVSVTNATSAQFAFVSSDLGSSFECSLDGAAFTSCTSPVNFMGLSDGAHSFNVRAQDVVGNVSAAPARWDWAVDTTAPGAPVITAPTEGQKIEDSNLSITGTAEPGSNVRVFIAGAEAGSVTAESSGNWSLSSSPSLGNGSYTIKATATDVAGNTSPESGARNFVVELKQDPPGDGGNGESGCGCAASGFDPAMSVMALAGLAAFVSRRRRK